MLINYRIVAKFLGYAALGMCVSFLPSVGWALYFCEYAAVPGILTASCIALAVGWGLHRLGRNAPEQLNQREALIIVFSSWVVVGLLGALPFMCTGVLDPIGAIFESISGFTTTGASVLDNPETVPKCVLFWRSLTHWFGGIGIIILFITVLPYLGAGGKLLFRTEASGPDPRAVRPRLKESAAVFCQVYLALTVLQTAALLLTGKMDLFESLCHTFGTLATGGFSTRQLSIGAYDSIAVETITIVFMIAGATSFALYFGFMQGKWLSLFRDLEWRVFVFLLAGAVLLVATNVAGYWGADPVAGETRSPNVSASIDPPALAHALRASVFNVTSVMTNTGFVTDDFDAWPFFSRMLLLVLMSIGGSAGSTSGGIKIVRLIMVVKMLYHHLERTFRPHTIRALRVGGQVIKEETQRAVCIFVLAYVACFAVCSLAMSSFGLPFQSAASSVAACISNTGPGLELVGATESYSTVPQGGLLFLCFCMILGRLELFTVLVLLVPSFWRSS